jgi:hypothetical protein
VLARVGSSPTIGTHCGMEKFGLSRWAHNPKIVGSNPSPATNKDMAERLGVGLQHLLHQFEPDCPFQGLLKVRIRTLNLDDAGLIPARPTIFLTALMGFFHLNL